MIDKRIKEKVEKINKIDKNDKVKIILKYYSENPIIDKISSIDKDFPYIILNFSSNKNINLYSTDLGLVFEDISHKHDCFVLVEDEIYNIETIELL